MERFWSKVDVRSDNECWPWLANRHVAGYGIFWLNGKNRRANRIALEVTFGKPDDDSLLALHSCDNPSCCNPKHLRWGTTKDNSDDMVLRKRSLFGENSARAVITDEVASKIMRMRVSGMKLDEIASELSLKRNLVMEVYTGRAWYHLHGVDGNPTLDELKRSKPANRLPAYNRVLTDEMIDRIFQGRMEGLTCKDISQELGVPEGTVSPVFSGIHFAERLGNHGNPTLEELLSVKSDLKRAIMHDDEAVILKLFKDGYTGASIAEKFKVGKATISRLRNKFRSEGHNI